jgi:hypothetical protein
MPDCRGCTSGDALLDEVKARLRGCFTERQLSSIDDSVRTRLGVRVCEPILRFDEGG